MTEDNSNGRKYGPQPIDAMMKELELDNHALVAASTEQLSHKMVAKARNGRFLSVRVRLKVLRAFNKVAKANMRLSDLFNY